MFIHILNAFEVISINADNQQGSLKILKTPQRLDAENLAAGKGFWMHPFVLHGKSWPSGFKDYDIV